MTFLDPQLTPLLHALAFTLISGPGIPVAVLSFVTIVAVAGIWHHDRERTRWHETARLAIEKGVPMPADPDGEKPEAPADRRHRQRMGLVIAGFVNLAVGVALFFGISSIPEARVARFFVSIPGFVGLALLGSALVDTLLRPKPAPADPARPQA